MTIEEIKQSAIDAISNEITEKAKNDSIVFLKKTLDETIKPIAQELVNTLKEQAKTESGWCSFRDKYFIPGLIDIAEFALDKVFGLMINASPVAADTVAPATDTVTADTVVAAATADSVTATDTVAAAEVTVPAAEATTVVTPTATPL